MPSAPLAVLLAAAGLNAGVGNDRLFGTGRQDLLSGADGDDILLGGQGVDRLRGGGGSDRFVFADVNESPTKKAVDRILDFNAADGDRVDLSAIDANIGEPDDQVFAFTQNPAGYSAWSSRDWLYADTDSDARLNFIARITSVKSLTAKALLL